MASQAHYIKTGGATGAWGGDSNVEGAHSGTCMSSAADGNAETCYPDQFTEIPDGATIDGIEVKAHAAITDGDDTIDTELFCTTQGASSTRTLSSAVSNLANCGAAVDDTVGTPTDLWDWTSVVGSDINGTDFYVLVTQMESGKVATCYVDYIEITIYYTAVVIEPLAGSSAGQSNVPNTTMKVSRKIIGTVGGQSGGLDNSPMKVSRKLISSELDPGACRGISNVPDAPMKVSRKLVSVAIVGQSNVPNAPMGIFVMLSGECQAQSGIGDIGGWLGTWKSRMKLTVDSGDIDGNLTYFPLTVFLGTSVGITNADISAIFDEVGANSKKIAITKADGFTQLYVEIEKWDNGAEVAVLHVSKGDLVLSSSGDTDLYIYFDNSQADNTTYVGDPESAPGESVWDANHVMVQHMNDFDTSNIHDSTDNDNDGIKKGANEPNEVAGKIGESQDFDGTDDYITFGDIPDTDIGNYDFTVNAWFKTNTISGRCLLGKSLEGALVKWWVISIGITGGAGAISAETDDNANKRTVATPDTWNDNAWHMVTFVHNDGTGYELYIDGVSKDTDIDNGDCSNNEDFTIGKAIRLVADDEWNGVVDEVRISHAARNDAWIAACYESQRDHLLTWTTAVETPAGISMKVSRKLIGMIPGQAGVDGIMEVARKIIGSVTAQSGGLDDSPLKVSRKLIGTVDGQGAAQAIMKVARKLIGSLGGQATLIASLTVTGAPGQIVSLIGLVSAQSTVTGHLRFTIQEPVVLIVTDPAKYLSAVSTIKGLVPVDIVKTLEVRPR